MTTFLEPHPSATDRAVVQLLRASELTDAHRSEWVALQESQLRYDSPFFRPEFLGDVAAVRGGLHVAAISSAQGTGYFPFHLRRGQIARAPARHLSDFEGAVLPDKADFDPGALLTACGLKSWRFHHLIASHPGCLNAMWALAQNPFIDLSDGFTAYREERREHRGRLIPEIERKLRKAEREFADVTFTLDDRDPAALEWLVTNKSRQLRAKGHWDFFRTPWTTPLFEQTLTHSSPAYRGLVSTLRYDGRIVAAHMGLQSHGVLHAWTHVFDPGEAKYSPGMVMLYLLARDASRAGIGRIDLGRGDEAYKQRFANGSISLAEGAVELHAIPRLLRRSWYFAREAIRDTAFGEPTQALVRRIRTWKRNLFHPDFGSSLFSENSRPVA